MDTAPTESTNGLESSTELLGRLHPGAHFVSIVVPTYNDWKDIEELADRIVRSVEPVAEHFEILVVDDGSDVQTRLELRRVEQMVPQLSVISLLRNYGQHNATLAGIRSARGDVCVTMDSDLQHPPEEIPKLLDALTAGNDLVYGVPNNSFKRRRSSILAKKAMRWMLNIDVAGSASAFRAFPTELREAFAEYNSPTVSLEVLLSWGARRVATVPITFADRAEGATHYTMARLIRHATTQVTGFSERPLQIASLMGLAMTMLGVIGIVLVVLNYFITGGGPAGFSTIVVIMLLLSGVQLLMLGIMGAYIARMHLRVMNRPAYVVRSGALSARASHDAQNTPTTYRSGESQRVGSTSTSESPRMITPER